ncbi:Protein of unknown function [Cnuella takakiae]|uniref:YetF C-terminal domain-containing protein n=1 Tax=Cnuella takakiae TaxID=1302690 RepID=A0A1M5IZ78_9BACT|nr:YetF domain-containing protein [Cnuella takakiae]OLY91420.1 hypothetical protein BUE76_05525 [Cnuella takakiae]SHG33073.1 Protein of unknown function [Cnuella takakiae]
MERLNEWWGINEDISPVEIAARAAVMFVLTLLLIRITGMRPFGKKDPFDIIIAFLIGGVLSRGVVGATPFFSAFAGALMLILVHKVLSWLSIHWKGFEKTVKGESLLLYKQGRYIAENMEKVGITENDIHEELRIECHTGSYEKIAEVYMEKTGKISFVRKD